MPVLPPSMRHFSSSSRFFSVFFLLCLLVLPAATRAEIDLPMSTVFKGRATFDRLVARAERENWAALPIGERTARVGLALAGTPYQGYTLEIDDRVESPSADFNGLDCWTFFEISLGFARMVHAKPPPYAPEDLLHFIELDRYRHGQCTGQYLSRIHFLEELFYDNEKRGLLTNITARLPGAERMPHRDIREMTVMWRHYRYLRNNPSLLPQMARVQEYVPGHGLLHLARGPRLPRRGRHAALSACIIETTPRAGGRPAFRLSRRQAR